LYEINKNQQFFNNFDNILFTKLNNKEEILLKILNFKSKTSLIKTDYDFKRTVLSKISSVFRNENYFYKSKYEILNTFNKTYDMKKDL
jgi:hypothetical protein